MTVQAAQASVLRHNKRVLASYYKRKRSRQCAWFGCRCRARRGYVMCEKHAARQRAYAAARREQQARELVLLHTMLLRDVVECREVG